MLFSGPRTHARDNQLTERKGFCLYQFGKCCSTIRLPHCSWAGTKVSEHVVVPIGWLAASPVNNLTTPLSTHPRVWRFSTHPSPQDFTTPLWIAACHESLGTLKIQTAPRTLLLRAPLLPRLPNVSLRRQTPITSSSGSLQASACNLSFSYWSLCLWYSENLQGCALVLFFPSEYHKVF